MTGTIKRNPIRKVDGIFISSLSAHLFRGWIVSEAAPRLANVISANGTVVARTNVFPRRSDIRIEGELGTARGFCITLLSSLPPEGFRLEVIDAQGDIHQTDIEKVRAFDTIPVKNPKLLTESEHLTGDAAVTYASTLIDLITGQPDWLSRLRRAPLMRDCIAKDGKSLLEDSLHSEEFLYILFGMIEEGLKSNRQLSPALLRERFPELAETDSEPLGQRADGIDDLIEKIRKVSLAGTDQLTLNTIVSETFRKPEIVKSILAKLPWLRTLMVRSLIESDLQGAWLKLIREQRSLPVMKATLARLEKGLGFEAALTSAVLSDSTSIDNLKTVLRDNRDLLKKIEADADLMGILVNIPAVQEQILRKFEPSRLRPINAASVPAPKKKPTNQESPRFSVVLGAFNGESLLSKTLDSLREQTFADYEVVLVDDGSTDSTFQIMQDFAASHPRTRVIRHEVNLGQAAAFNTGVAASKGKYVAFLDADDLWFPNKLQTCDAFISIVPDADFIQHNLYLMIGDWPSERNFRPTLASGDFIQQMKDSKTALPGPFTPTAGMVMSRRILDQILPIPVALRICADGYLTRTAAALTSVVTIPVSLGYYRIHGNNATIGNDEYDVDGYAFRVLGPILQDFYAKLPKPIILDATKLSRVRRQVAVQQSAPVASADTLGDKLRDAIVYMTLGVDRGSSFSPLFRTLLRSARDKSIRSDFEALLQDLNRGVVTPEEEPVLRALEYWIATTMADHGKLKDRARSLMQVGAGSKTIAGLLLTAAQESKNSDLVEELLQSGLASGTIGLTHAAAAFARMGSVEGIATYLGIQRMLVECAGQNSAYFDSIDWIAETAETVDAWRDELRQSGSSAKMFAVRRLAPPPSVGNAIAKEMAALGREPENKEEDWTRAAALDISGATVFGGEWFIRSAEGYVVIDGNVGTPHHAPSAYGNVGQPLSRFNLIHREPVRNLGAVVLLGGDNNYYHWIHDVLPRARWYTTDDRLHGLNALVGPRQRSFQDEILQRLGISEDKQVEIQFPEVAVADRIVLPMVGPQNRTFRNIYGPIRHQFHDEAGMLFFPEYSCEPCEPRQGKRLFVRRGAVNHRGLVNEDEVAALFAARGFMVIDGAAMSVAEQVAAFNKASIVIGPHGAALVNLCFSRPGTRVIELAFPTWTPAYFETISKARGLRYSRFFMKVAHDPSLPISFANGYLHPDLVPQIIDTSLSDQ